MTAKVDLRGKSLEHAPPTENALELWDVCDRTVLDTELDDCRRLLRP
jgi:hypothetical protein